MRKIFILSIVLCTVIFCGFLWSDYNSDEKYVVRIGHNNSVTALMLFVADEKGWFRDADIDVDIVMTAGGGDQMVSLAQAGHLDVYVNSVVLSLLSSHIVSPDRVKIILTHPWYKKDPFDSILVRADSDIHSLDDLEGKKIGVFPVRFFEVFLDDYFKDRNINNISFLPLTIPNQLGALEVGNIDALHTIETTNATAISSGKFRRLYGSPFADVLNPMSVGHGAVTVKFLNEHPELSRDVIDILTRAIIWIRGNDMEAREILMKRLNLTEEAAMITNLEPTQTYKEQDVSDLKAFADLVFGMDEISREINLEEIEGFMYEP